MTAQEQQMIQGLADRINNTQLPDKDPEAEQYLQQTLGRNPDAQYILAQTILVQQYALEQAQRQLADARAQLEQLRQQPPPEAKHGSFLGNLLGHHGDPQPPRPAAPAYRPQQYAPVPVYAPAAQYGAPPAYGVPAGYGAPQQGGFLRSAMQTAAGVAAGALAFEGIESLMHGFEHNAGYGSGFGGGGRPEEIINNYYGDSAGHSEHPLSSDIDDRRGESAFSQAVDSNERDGRTQDGSTQDGSDTQDTSSQDFASDDNVASADTDSGDSSFDDGSSGGDDSSGGGDGGF